MQPDFSEPYREVIALGRMAPATYAAALEHMLTQLRVALTALPWEIALPIIDQRSTELEGLNQQTYFGALQDFLKKILAGEWPDRNGCPCCYGCGCFKCDFHGTKDGFALMEKFEAEANEAWDEDCRRQEEYVKGGVCSTCKATCPKEALTLCRPHSLGETGEMTCAGEDLWQEERYHE